MKTNWEKVRGLVKNTDKAVLREVIKVDGHTIYDPAKFTDAGLDATVVQAFTKELHSGANYKEQLHGKDGKEVESLIGVHGLDVLEFVASVFDVSSWKMGRGSRAEHLCEQLLEKWK